MLVRDVSSQGNSPVRYQMGKELTIKIFGQ